MKFPAMPVWSGAGRQGTGPMRLRVRMCLRSNGFSVLEITICLILVALLAVIAIPNVLKARAKSQIRDAEVEVAMIATAIQRLAWDTGNWPGGVNRGEIQNPELWDLTTAAAGLLSCDTSKFKNWKGPYIREIPLDPWGKRYFFDPDYTLPDHRTLPVVGSFGPNRVGPNVYDNDNIIVVLQTKF